MKQNNKQTEERIFIGYCRIDSEDIRVPIERGDKESFTRFMRTHIVSRNQLGEVSVYLEEDKQVLEKITEILENLNFLKGEIFGEKIKEELMKLRLVGTDIRSNIPVPFLPIGVYKREETNCLDFFSFTEFWVKIQCVYRWIEEIVCVAA